MLQLKRPVFKYLVGVNNLVDARNLYKQKALVLHPDVGGTVESFQQLIQEWDYIKKVPSILPISATQAKPKVDTPPYNQGGFTARPNYSNLHKEEKKSEILEYDQFKFIIDNMVEQVKGKGFKIGMVYFNYLEFITATKLKVSKKQLEYIGAKLGYSTGWAYFKEQELTKTKLMI